MSSIFSSFNITGTLGSINLGGATVIGTLGNGTIIGNFGGATVRTSPGLTFLLVLFVYCGCMLLNSVINLLMACIWLSPIVKGILGPGILIICINSVADLVDFSVMENLGMMRCCVNNSTTYACIFSFMFCV